MNKINIIITFIFCMFVTSVAFSVCGGLDAKHHNCIGLTNNTGRTIYYLTTDPTKPGIQILSNTSTSYTYNNKETQSYTLCAGNNCSKGVILSRKLRSGGDEMVCATGNASSLGFRIGKNANPNLVLGPGSGSCIWTIAQEEVTVKFMPGQYK